MARVRRWLCPPARLPRPDGDNSAAGQHPLGGSPQPPALPDAARSAYCPNFLKVVKSWNFFLVCCHYTAHIVRCSTEFITLDINFDMTRIQFCCNISAGCYIGRYKVERLTDAPD